MCVFFPFIPDIKFVGRTSRGHTGGRSHRISHLPSFCGACLNFSREKDPAIPFPRRPLSRILCTNDLIVLHPLGKFLCLVFLVRKSRLPGSNSRPNVSEGYEVPLNYRGDRRCVPLKFSHSLSSSTVKSSFVQSAPRPSEHTPVKTFMFYLNLFKFSRARLLYPNTIDSSRPLLSQVTPGRHAPIDWSLPLYYKLSPWQLRSGRVDSPA